MASLFLKQGHRRGAVGLSVSLAVWLGLLVVAPAGDVTTYRGPQNNGIYDETGLMKAWPADGPKLLWKQPLGQGYGGVSVVDGMVWIVSGSSAHLYGITLDGEVKQKIPVGGAGWKRFTGPRSTPLIRDGMAVVALPNADIHGIDLATGEKKWKVNAWKDFGAGVGSQGWGYPSSFASFENKVILNPVSRTNATPPIVAVDIATGKTVWEADPGDNKRYSCGDHAAAVFRHNGRWLNVNPTWRYILCLDPQTGKRLWEIPDPDTGKGSEKGMTPVYGDGYVLFDIAGIVTCIKLNKDGTDFTLKWARQYSSQRFSHAVILNGRVYLGTGLVEKRWLGADALTKANMQDLRLKDLQRSNTDKPLPSFPSGLVCLDAESGAFIDVIRIEPYLGHVISADGMLYAVNFDPSVGNNQGRTLYLIKPTDAGMEIAGKFQLPALPADLKVGDVEWQACVNPVVAQGRLFTLYGQLWCHDLRPKHNAPPAPPLVRMPKTGLVDLYLRNFLDGQHDLYLTLDVKDGGFVSGMAMAPEWNRATHAVVMQELAVEEDGFKGKMMIMLNSDGTAPADNKPIDRNVAFNARYARGVLQGEYKVQDGAKGRLGGRMTP
jgi:outer membrane protein assembly factor BamB